MFFYGRRNDWLTVHDDFFTLLLEMSLAKEAKEALPARGPRGVVTAAGRLVAKSDLLGFFVRRWGTADGEEIAELPSAKVYFQYILPFVLGDPWCLDIQGKGG